VFTRDLQLADLVPARVLGPLVYEAHAVEALMYGERGALYGTGETPDRAKAGAHRRPRGPRLAARRRLSSPPTARHPGLVRGRARRARRHTA
jgi:hypothetical protein